MNHASAVKKQIGKEVKQVAYDLDYSREQVYKLISDTYSSHPVKKTGDLAASTDSHAIAKYVAARSGCRVVEPFSPKDAQNYAIIPLMAVEFGELMQTVGEAHEDGKITLEECGVIRAAMNDVGSVVEGWLQHVEKGEGL